MPVGALPPQLAALNRTFLNVVELTVRAALEESRDHVYQAALLDPNTAATLTTAQTVAMCDELFAAHRDLLPAGVRGRLTQCVPSRLITAVAHRRAPGHRDPAPRLARGRGGAGRGTPSAAAARAARGSRRPCTGARCGSPASPGTARWSRRPAWPGTRPGCPAA